MDLNGRSALVTGGAGEDVRLDGALHFPPT
jgi:hypothetical protein